MKHVFGHGRGHLTVGELIVMLAPLPPDARVCVSCTTGPGLCTDQEATGQVDYYDGENEVLIWADGGTQAST